MSWEEFPGSCLSFGSFKARSLLEIGTYLRDGVGGAGMGQDGGLRAEGSQGSHDLGNVGDIAVGGGTSNSGENGGNRVLHLGGLVVGNN